jgi:hypothetical protein
MSDKLVADIAAYTTHIKFNRRTFMLLTGFEPATPVVEWLQTYAVD